MKSARPSPPSPERYDEVAYRDALQRLGLVPPVDLEQIQLAYRRSARRAHPDLVPEGPDREEATERIQRINAARDYVVRHHGNHRSKTRSRNGSNDRASWWFLPITAVHALASLLVLGPFLLLSHLIGARGRERWRSFPLSGAVGRAWRVWRGIGPHVGTFGLFLLVEGIVVQAWFGGAFLILAATDLASLLTGTKNELRDHTVVSRVHGLLREAERAL